MTRSQVGAWRTHRQHAGARLMARTLKKGKLPFVKKTGPRPDTMPHNDTSTAIREWPHGEWRTRRQHAGAVAQQVAAGLGQDVLAVQRTQHAGQLLRVALQQAADLDRLRQPGVRRTNEVRDQGTGCLATGEVLFGLCRSARLMLLDCIVALILSPIIHKLHDWPVSASACGDHHRGLV